MQHAIAYYRVSTARQGRSGLGIAAQRAAVARFAEAEGYSLIGEFTEVETSKGVPMIESLRASGVRDLRGLAAALNNLGARPARGGSGKCRT